MRSIDERLNLSASAAPRLDASNLRAPVEETAAATIQRAHAAAVAADPAADVHAAADDAPIHSTLAAPAIGLGYASLDAIQDQDVAFVMTDHGLTTVTSGVQGYLVKSDVPMDATLAKILGFGHASAAFANVSSVLSDLSRAPAGEIDQGNGHGWDLAGGSGNETINASAYDDVIHGAAGNDIVEAAGGDDIVWGGAGLDTLRGSDGDDQLWGAAGNDSLEGGTGDDVLFAGSGADTLQGGEGSDLVLGGIGNDSMVGGAGDDLLVGGGNADKLTGGDGADIFLFAQGDSGVGDTNQDKVLDFVVGEDKLDLTSFTKPVHLVDAFGHHAFELVITDNADGTTLLQIDLNGDGVSDQEILVTTSDGGHIGAGDLVI